MLLISNANKQGKPNLFTNTLVTEIDGTDKEIALIKANLPNCWHSTSAASVKDHAFILKAPAAMALSASWLAILNETNTTCLPQKRDLKNLHLSGKKRINLPRHTPLTSLFFRGLA